MGADIEVFYYSGGFTRTLLPQSAALLDRLPVGRRERIVRLAHIEQRASELATLRLLELAMIACGHTAFRLGDIDYGPTGRSDKPEWMGGSADFSISHTAATVACAISARGRIGLDVEERRTLDPHVVTRLLSDDASLREGLDESNAVERWTQIEAVAKGAGVGVARARQIRWRGSTVELQGRNWWLHRIDCGPTHEAHAAIDCDGATVAVTRVDAL